MYIPGVTGGHPVTQLLIDVHPLLYVESFLQLDSTRITSYLSLEKYSLVEVPLARWSFDEVPGFGLWVSTAPIGSAYLPFVWFQENQ